MKTTNQPVIIQGGMGVAVSAWQLAKAVSQTGQLGVVSGTALDTVLLRRLGLGDPGAHMRRALNEFPFPAVAERIVEQYFVPDGKAASEPFSPCRRLSAQSTVSQIELVVAANFVEVYLAKEDHEGLIGINFLEKIQTPTLPSIYGAMLAGVDYVLVGAGIPLHIPGVLDRFADGKPAELPLHVHGAGDDEHFVTRFDPAEFTQGHVPWLRRPKFLAIVSSATLATMLTKRASGTVDGFVVEGPTAGGHNAPPRGKMNLNQRGEPVYGKRDVARLESFRAVGLPFWLAGSYGSPERVKEALNEGAAGVQVGTAFAFCKESGLRADIRERVLRMCRDEKLDVFTDAAASPAGFPFKVLRLTGSLSDPALYQARQRRCDLGYLSQAYRKQDGAVGWRCPAEPPDAYVHKGGDLADTVGRKCLCNGLLANVGLAQSRRDGQQELPIVTCGDDVKNLARFLPPTGPLTYSARDVVEHLVSNVSADVPLAS